MTTNDDLENNKFGTYYIVIRLISSPYLWDSGNSGNSVKSGNSSDYSYNMSN